MSPASLSRRWVEPRSTEKGLLLLLWKQRDLHVILRVEVRLRRLLNRRRVQLLVVLRHPPQAGDVVATLVPQHDLTEQIAVLLDAGLELAQKRFPHVVHLRFGRTAGLERLDLLQDSLDQIVRALRIGPKLDPDAVLRPGYPVVVLAGRD